MGLKASTAAKEEAPIMDLMMCENWELEIIIEATLNSPTEGEKINEHSTYWSDKILEMTRYGYEVISADELRDTLSRSGNNPMKVALWVPSSLAVSLSTPLVRRLIINDDSNEDHNITDVYILGGKVVSSTYAINKAIEDFAKNKQQQAAVDNGRTTKAESSTSSKGLLKSIFNSSTKQSNPPEDAEGRPAELAAPAEAQKSRGLTRKFSSKVNFALHLQLHQDDVGPPDTPFDSSLIATDFIPTRLNLSQKSEIQPSEQVSPSAQPQKSTILTRKASSKANLFPQPQSESEQDDYIGISQQQTRSDGLHMSEITINPLSASGKCLLAPLIDDDEEKLPL